MKTLFSLLVIFTTLTAGPTHATEPCDGAVTVRVNGLVCDFCARALEKMFGERREVSGIMVDLDNGKVVITLQPGQTLDDAVLTQLITDSGYNVAEIQREC